MTEPLARLGDLMAWATGYDLIAALVLDGPRGERRQDLLRIPELVPLLGGVAEDELLADHFDLLGRAVPPFANAFLDQSALAGGEQAAALGRLYRDLGFAPPLDAPGEDHLGVILQALAHAILTEVEMLRHGETAAARDARRRQATLLDDHLLAWVWPLTYAVAGQPYPLYTKLTGAMLEVLAAHRASLDTAAALPRDEPVLPVPTEPDLKLLARWLVAPACSGVFWTRRDVQAIAQGEDLPKSFGESRAGLFTDLLSDADRFGRLRAVLERFAASAESAATFYDTAPRPLLGATAPWARRARAAAHALRTLAAEAAAHDG